MKKIIFLILSIGLSFGLLAQDTSELYAKLNKALIKNKSKKAEKILKELALIESDNFIFSLTSAQYYSGINKLDTAAICIERAIDQYKILPISHDSENFISTRDSLYKLSIMIFDKIISAKPDGRHYCNRGALKKDIGLYNESIIDFTKAIEINASDYMSYYNRGMAYRQLNQLDSAISDYTKCNQLNPDYASAYLNKGYALLFKAEYTNAIKEFEIALSKAISVKEAGYTLNNIGFANYKLHEYATATAYINKSLEVYPVNSFAYKNLALIDLAMHDKEKACKNIQKSIDLGFVNQFGNEILDLKKEHCE